MHNHRRTSHRPSTETKTSTSTLSQVPDIPDRQTTADRRSSAVLRLHSDTLGIHTHKPASYFSKCFSVILYIRLNQQIRFLVFSCATIIRVAPSVNIHHQRRDKESIQAFITAQLTLTTLLHSFLNASYPRPLTFNSRNL